MMLIICFATIMHLFGKIESSKEVMKSFSYSFGLKMFECGEHANYTRAMAVDILKFWDPKHSLVIEETGCLVICVLIKLDLIESDGKLIRVNIEEYLKSNGADDALVNYLVDLAYRCQSQHLLVKNRCAAALAMARCFRMDIHRRGWTPNIITLQKIPH